MLTQMLYATDAATARQMIPNINLALMFLMLLLSRLDRSNLVGKGERVGMDEPKRQNVGR